jgi:pimeloyl-ACP methyl ester carboxylesterase
MSPVATLLAWRRYGAGPIRVLLLHGFSDSADCWEPFARRHRDLGGMLAVDARGHGRSPLPDGGTGPLRQAADHATVLDQLDVTDPVLVIGHSMGALTALALAVDHPHRVSALILEDPPLTSDQARIRTMPDWLTALRALDTDGRIAAGRDGNPRWTHAELVPWAASKADIDPEFCHRPGDTADPMNELVRWVDCPVLLIAGAPEHGGMLTAADLDTAARFAPSTVTSAIIRTAGHNIRRDDPAAYDDAVRRFLAVHHR